jgi:Tfp pilus assembly protein FimT
MSLPRPLIVVAILAALGVAFVPATAGALTSGQAKNELTSTQEKLELTRARIAARRSMTSDTSRLTPARPVIRFSSASKPSSSEARAAAFIAQATASSSLA